LSFGTGAGIAVGQAMAGFLGPVFGWRLAAVAGAKGSTPATVVPTSTFICGP